MDYDKSQHGQSQHIFKLFKGIEAIKMQTGFVLEIGSLDGNIDSNAFPFFKYGWKGICIEPDDVSFKLLQKFYYNSDKVQTFNICITPIDNNEVNFYAVNKELPYQDHGCSTLNLNFAKKIGDNIHHKPYTLYTKLGLSLNTLFKAFINHSIDYMVMDCECVDELNILSIDFSIFRPKIIQAEFQYDIEIEDIKMFDQARQHLILNGYYFKKIPNSRDILAVDKSNCNNLDLIDFLNIN